MPAGMHMEPGAAERALRESEDRQAFLLTLSDALRPIEDAVAIQGEACRRLGERLGVDRAYYMEVDETAGRARVERDWVRAGGGPSLAGEHRVADFAWSVAILRRGECHVVSDTQSSPLVPPPERPPAAALRIIASMGAPLIKEGRLVGALCVRAAAPREWAEADVTMLREVADRVWAAVERARAEKARRASEARYRALVENVPDYAIILLDAHGVVTEWTPGAERMNGYGSQEVVGRHVSMLYTPEQAAAGEPAAELAEAAATGRVEREGWRVRKGGERLWVNEIATAIHDHDGRLLGFAKIARDLTEQRRVGAATERARVLADRASLRHQLLLAEEEERRRLSRELHDEAGQHLTALGLGLQALSDIAVAGSEVDRRATQLRELASTLGRELHAIAVRLRPRALDDFGLEAAVAAYAEEWSRQSGIRIDVHAPRDADRLSSAIESAIYRVVQEALTNVARHSEATHASIVLERRDGKLVAVVEDDGRGFDPADDARGDDAPGLGLLGIRERVELLGGTVVIESAPGSGTSLYVRIPIAVASNGAPDGE